MSAIASILGAFGVGKSTVYDWGQQNADFIKLQFKYSLTLRNKLADGEITQDYYNANYWLTTETLTPPYNGWFDEFKAAVDSENLDWLAKQVGQSVSELTAYMGSALRGVATAAGDIVGTAISSTSTGLAKGFFGSLNPIGWVAVIGLGLVVFYGFKTGTIQKAFKLAAI